MRAILLLVLGVVALSACERYQQATRAKGLELRARDYIKAVRWANFEAAASFLRRRDGALPVSSMDEFKGIRVTHSEMTVSSAGPEATEALMTAVFDYYSDDQPSVRETVQSVTWWWDPLDEVWYIDGGLPEFR